MYMRKIVLFCLWCFCFSASAANVPLNSVEGGKMLASSILHGDAKPFLSEVRYFTYQKNIYFCGVASAAILLNTLKATPPVDPNFGDYRLFTQDNLFTPELANKTGITFFSIIGQGLTLTKETQLLNAFSGIKAQAYPMGTLTEEQVKKILVKALKSDKLLVLANIFRPSMKEVGGGHFSPVAAYDSKSDSVLFMDVTSYKYGPTWVPMKTLYAAMSTRDPTEAYRGFILVSKQ